MSYLSDTWRECYVPPDVVARIRKLCDGAGETPFVEDGAIQEFLPLCQRDSPQFLSVSEIISRGHATSLREFAKELLLIRVFIPQLCHTAVVSFGIRLAEF